MTTENKKGYFGEFGGSYVPEVVQKALDELEIAYNKYKDDEEFLKEYHHYLKDYSGRETPLYFAESLTNYLGGAKIYLKREDLNHLGAHKLNNVIGQILLAIFFRIVYTRKNLKLKGGSRNETNTNNN